MNSRPLILFPALLFALFGLPAVSFLSAAPAAVQDQSLPFVYQGDGMTVVIVSINRSESEATGTVYLNGSDGMGVTLRLRTDANGYERASGKVQTPGGEKRITSKENEDGSLRVRFDKATFVLALVPDRQIPKPKPQAGEKTGKPAPFKKGRGVVPALDRVVLQQHTFNDPSMRGMPSHTMLVPKGWKVEGGAFWMNVAYYNALPSQDITVTSPRGVSVHVGPSLSARDYLPGGQYGSQRPAEGTESKGLPILYMPQDLDAWKKWFQERGVPLSVPNATHIKVHNGVVVPELTSLLRRQLQPVFQQLLQGQEINASVGLRSDGDCAVLAFEITYTEGGREWEEIRMFATSYFLLESKFTGTDISWDVMGGATFKAPKGELEANMALLKAVGDSLRMTDQWFNMRADMQAKLAKMSAETARVALRESQKRSRIIAQTGAEINEIINTGYATREAIKDRTYDRVINTIRGTEDYVVPGTNTYVQLPSSYENVYSNGQGEYLLSNDLLYDPNTDSQLNNTTWTSMAIR